MNDSGVQCVRNAHCLHVQTGVTPQERVPTHAHRLLPKQTEQTAQNPTCYAAAQAPAGSRPAATNFLIHALESGQGIYQFVAPPAHRNSRRSHRSILDDLKQRMEPGSDEAQRLLGDRFRLTGIELIETGDRQSDHVHYRITAEEVHGAAPRREFTTVLTQAKLRFTDRVLRSDDIVRASALLDAHQGETAKLSRAAIQNADPSQLVVSHAGIGRNATLIVYRDLKSKIDAGHLTRDTLDTALFHAIAGYRAIRGPRFIHSVQQLAALREALWLQLPALRQGPNNGRGITPGLRTPTNGRGSPAEILTPAPVATPVATPVPTPVATPVPRPVATPVPTPVATPVPTPVATPVATQVPASVATPPAEPPAAPTTALTRPINQQADADGHFRFHATEAQNGHFSNDWAGQAIRLDGKKLFKTAGHFLQYIKYHNAQTINLAKRAARYNIMKRIINAATPQKAREIAMSPFNRPFLRKEAVWPGTELLLTYMVVYQKFWQDETLRQQLLATNDALLIQDTPEESPDLYWGTLNGRGANVMGQILMRVRDDLKNPRSLKSYDVQAEFNDEARKWK